MRKTLSFLLALCTLLTLGTLPAAAEGAAFLPGVTAEMTDPAFWTRGMEEPDRVLASPEEIARINAEALAAPGSNMHDLKNLPETFDGIARCESLKKGMEADADYYIGWTWDETGRELTRESFAPVIANCDDPGAAEEMPLRYGVAVNRTALLCFPMEHQILDDPADLDFDYQPLVGIRVNEPVAIFTASADGKYYQAFTSSCSGWVRAEDIALCRDKEEWLSAWDLPAEKRLVFWGDKLYTDYSNTAPGTACRLLTMGTVLERMELADPDMLVVNRLPIHNYAVYLPIRNEDGSYGKTPALINAREKLSEDYLPLTGANLARVALASLGDAYGWGGGLNNEDCTSLNRTVFSCFGLDLPRNENRQLAMAMPKRTDLTSMTTEEKEALLDLLPLGTLLNFPGHQMMYLGKADGAYYVVSTVSSIMSPYSGKRQRTRQVQINTLDIKRANGRTWMQELNTAYIPWVYLPEGEEGPMPSLLWYHDAAYYCLTRGLMDAAEGGYFRPQEKVSLSDASEILRRALDRSGTAADGGADGLLAEAQGILSGIGASLAPDDPLTREMTAVILFRCGELLGLDTSGRASLEGFPDGGAAAPGAKDAMEWAVSAALFRGSTDGTLALQRGITRAELASIIFRMAALIVSPQEGAP